MSRELRIDFLEDHIRYQRKSHRGKQELIAKALGAGKGVTHILDLTCGLAEDAFFLAQIGFYVTALERSEVIFQILRQSLQKARSEQPQNPALSRLEIHFSDSIKFLRSSSIEVWRHPGVALYLDPMFPEKKKSALPRKEMQLFRQLVGGDEDATELLSAALNSGVGRVVVKRPIKAPPLGQGEPIHMFKGKTIRYDLYVPNHQGTDEGL